MFLIWGKVGCCCLMVTLVSGPQGLPLVPLCVFTVKGVGSPACGGPGLVPKTLVEGLSKNPTVALLAAVTPPSTSTTLLFPTERVCTTVLGL